MNINDLLLELKFVRISLPKTMKFSEKIERMRKKEYNPFYLVHVSRKLSKPITRVLIHTPVSANQVSLFIIIIGIIGSGMVAFGSIWAMFFGATLMHLTIILDSVDGEVARYKKRVTLTGPFLDVFSHLVVNPLMIFSLGYGIYHHTGWELALIFGFLSSMFSTSVVLTAIKVAVIDEIMNRRFAKKDLLPKEYILPKEQIDVKGGSDSSARKLYRFYDKRFKGLLSFPLKVVQIHIVVSVELLNYYFNFMPPFLFPLVYIILFGLVSVLRQIISFIVHYRSKTIYHYYNLLFAK